MKPGVTILPFAETIWAARSSGISGVDDSASLDQQIAFLIRSSLSLRQGSKRFAGCRQPAGSQHCRPSRENGSGKLSTIDHEFISSRLLHYRTAQQTGERRQKINV
jgi:hypothetical protein